MTAWRTTPLPPGWARTRRRILRRDGWTCTVVDCGRPATEVDHIVPAHRGGSEDDDNLASLCRWHHARKTSSEANAARRLVPRERSQRPAERHPGFTN